MKGRKGLAFILAAALTFGCAVTSYADGATSSTGIGNDTGHLDTNITTSVMPTDNSVADIFSYYADPERLVHAAGDKLNNTTTGSSVTANNYGIYFNGTNTQTSTNAVITLKNYADVDVTVRATVVTAGTMALTTNSAINTVTDGAAQVYLALNLKQGSTTTSATIQAAGTTKSLKVAGQTTKFDTVITDGAYVLQEKDSQTWDTVEISLNGAVSQAIITDSDAAPNVKLEWSVTKHSDEPSVEFTNAGVLTISSMKEGQSVLSAIMTGKKDGKNFSYDLKTTSSVNWNSEGTRAELVGTWPTWLSGVGKVTVTVEFSDHTTKTAEATF